jgi:serine/threonine protein kinase
VRFDRGDEPSQMHKTIGDFRILRELGRGGMGVVYEAQQVSMGRRVALKVLPVAALAQERSLQRFRNEVRAAGASRSEQTWHTGHFTNGTHIANQRRFCGKPILSVTDASSAISPISWTLAFVSNRDDFNSDIGQSINDEVGKSLH